MVFDVGPFKIAVAVEDRERVVNQREVYRRHRHAGAVGQLVDKKIVARKERLLKR
jgi:hypothetical protein